MTDSRTPKNIYIRVSAETRRDLQILKGKMDRRTYDDVIQSLVEQIKTTNY